MNRRAMRPLEIYACHQDIYTVASFSLSATLPTVSAAAPAAAFAASLGLDALLSFAFCFWEVVSLGSSLVKGMKSGAPGRYFRRGSGTLSPCRLGQYILPFVSQEIEMPLTYVLRLVILHDAAHRACSSTQRGIETVNIGLLYIRLFLATEPYLKGARLVVGAVGARDKLLVFTPV